jgi:hypothetical protein
MPTKNGVPDILFCDLFEIHCLYSLHDNKLVKLPEETAKKFYGIRFSGTPVYRGNHPETIKTIKEPVLFVSLENFHDAVDFKREPYRQELIKIANEFILLAIECVVIAKK